MRDTLLAQRQYYDKRLKELSQIEDPEQRHQQEEDLFYDEAVGEFS
ncbi:TPA: hypothetical protein HA241_04480 [Candidatus Woesearchaeota archaeon]|nr:hypothetical protein [Candidatus Woesearchaeota archaeon]